MRVRRVLVSAELLVRAMETGNRINVYLKEGLPAGARLVGAHALAHSLDSGPHDVDQVALIFEHRTFTEYDGPPATAPLLDLILQRCYDGPSDTGGANATTGDVGGSGVRSGFTGDGRPSGPGTDAGSRKRGDRRG